MDVAMLVGSAGVGLLLLAFAANLAGALPSGSRAYAALDAAGAGLASAASWMIDFVPFVVLEAIWTAVALAALVRGRPLGAGGGSR